MSVKISSWVWHGSNAKGNDLLVLLALADNANDQGVCWPSLAYLAEKTRLHPNTIRARLKSLREQGILSWDERPGGSNMFRINTETPTNSSTPTDSVPLPEYVPHPYSLGVGDPYMLAVGEPSLTVKEPSIPACGEMFEIFWTAWPLKKGKKEARLAFEKAIKRVSLETILDGVERYKKSLGPNPDWTKVKWAQGWLNGDRWEDETVPVAENKPTYTYGDRPPPPEGKRYAADIIEGI